MNVAKHSFVDELCVDLCRGGKSNPALFIGQTPSPKDPLSLSPAVWWFSKIGYACCICLLFKDCFYVCAHICVRVCTCTCLRIPEQDGRPLAVGVVDVCEPPTWMLGNDPVPLLALLLLLKKETML